MSLLYVVAESEQDAQFYAWCAEAVTGLTYDYYPLRLRKGDGELAVQEQMGDALKLANAAAGGGDVYFIASIDNDRAPHPENQQRLNRNQLPPDDQERESRLDWLDFQVKEVLRANPAKWKLGLAIAVPVEMLESWLIQIFEPEVDERALPFFSYRSELGAKSYYGRPPPSQCKDWCGELRNKLGILNRQEFLMEAVLQLEPEALAARSASFRLFKEGLDAWSLMTSSESEPIDG